MGVFFERHFGKVIVSMVFIVLLSVLMLASEIMRRDSYIKHVIAPQYNEFANHSSTHKKFMGLLRACTQKQTPTNSHSVCINVASIAVDDAENGSQVVREFGEIDLSLIYNEELVSWIPFLWKFNGHAGGYKHKLVTHTPKQTELK